MRGRILAAIATGAALGCRASEPAVERPAAPASATAPPSATVATTATALAVTPSVTASASVPTPPATVAGPRCREASSKREEYCLDAFTSPPRQDGSHAPYDARGCVSAASVNDGCNGIYEVLSGPTMKGKKCCFTVCTGIPAPCGRVLVDDTGRVRRAAVVPNWDWAIAGSERVLAAEVRSAWLDDALLEHASVAAFARFSLELLAVGAPPSFVIAAHRAALDEIEHAQLCFSLAQGASGGGRRGPGPLSLSGITPQTKLAAVAASAADECCSGETFAALIARRALADAVDPAARAALERIASDEERHAELGWSFVAWARARGGEDVAAAIDAGFARGRARIAAAVAPRFSDRVRAAAAGRIDEGGLGAAKRAAEDAIDCGLAALALPTSLSRPYLARPRS